ncbi:MAG: EAL domain-containing protein [Candidatus Pseudoruminococcus sp.]|uniref:EAL domain-containing protein n=1 Tax=Candidatus Pseudoruminococcus sp. TaxID=3101048 RepID=UPI002A7AC405|nr:EAL domain-containing protein [Ruminococcus sp.]MDY2783587.1 EAL domain-containing protein [Candidatus Pseudoruminococcus sp.]
MVNKIHDEEIRILISDSNPENRKIFAKALEEKYLIIEAESGDETLQILVKNNYSIDLMIISDKLSDRADVDVLKNLKNSYYLNDIPVMLIADGIEENIQSVYDIGILDCISANMNKAAIIRRVENALMLTAREKNFIRIISEQKKEFDDNNFQFQDIDQLTGTLNINGFRKRAEYLIRNNPNEKYVMWFCDIKKFKFVNDLFGYEVGDRLIRYWAGLVVKLIGDNEACGRFSGDTLVTLTKFKGEDDIRKNFDIVCNKVCNYLIRPGTSYNVEIAAGIYELKPEDMSNPNINQMFDWANVAQKSVKNLSGNQLGIFGEEMWRKQWRELVISQSIDSALENGEISVWLQPQYNFVTDRIIGAEALCRWTHSSLGWISPGEFIPILERTGQIAQLDYYIWEQACKLMRKWLDQGSFIPVSVSVNISRIDLLDDRIYSRLTNLLKKYDIPASMLRLEITESAYMSKPEVLIGVVDKLHELGFTVEMDDFGSGFSSLNMLKEVQVDVLKMDLRFLQNEKNGNGDKGGKIINAVIRMAHELTIPVVAEGVETKQQALFLSNVGCALMQGYYFSKPLPVEEFEELVKTMHERKDNEIRNLDSIIEDDIKESSAQITPLKYSHYLLTPDFKLAKCDANFTEITGYTWEDVIENQLTQYDLILEEERAVYRKIIDDTLKTSQEVYLKHRIKRKDGTLVFVNCLGHPAINGYTGEHCFAVRIVADMTEK